MKRAFPVMVSCATLLLVAGCGSSSKSSSSSAPAPATTGGAPPATAGGTAAPATPAKRGVVKVAYRNILIAPDPITVHVGQTVRWTNFDDTKHNVTFQSGPGKLASPDLGKGGTYSFKADMVGAIKYLCTFHPASMTGTINVVP